MSALIVEPTRNTNVGRVVVEVIVENFEDLQRAERGEISKEQVRRVNVPALVDTGATFFCLPQSLIERLGLSFQRHKGAKTVTGSFLMSIYAAARLTVQGRDCNVEVMALPENRQAILGQLPLEAMDWWIDVTNQRLIGNPEHGGQWMAEINGSELS